MISFKLGIWAFVRYLQPLLLIMFPAKYNYCHLDRANKVYPIVFATYVGQPHG